MIEFLHNTTPKGQKYLNARNNYWDANMNQAAIADVQQVGDIALYRRQGRWVDSRLVHRESNIKPKRVITFDSEAFKKLALKLAAEGRQGCISLPEDVLLTIDGEPVLIQAIKKR